MIGCFSVIMPLEDNRFDLFLKTLKAYEKVSVTNNDELIIVSRTITQIDDVSPFKLAKLVNYEHEGEYFNPSKALNLGVLNASNERIIITSPEVMPKTDVFAQLREKKDENVVCQVFDQSKNGVEPYFSLVNKNFRSNTPSMYFLACFNKCDIEKINGWDEDFMIGYAYEDDDFGARWVRKQIPFVVADDIVGVHQWHPRFSLSSSGAKYNCDLFEKNNKENIIFVKNGLVKEL